MDFPYLCCNERHEEGDTLFHGGAQPIFPPKIAGGDDERCTDESTPHSMRVFHVPDKLELA